VTSSRDRVRSGDIAAGLLAFLLFLLSLYL
jgi:hypothetical protein